MLQEDASISRGASKKEGFTLFTTSNFNELQAEYNIYSVPSV